MHRESFSLNLKQRQTHNPRAYASVPREREPKRAVVKPPRSPLAWICVCFKYVMYASHRRPVFCCCYENVRKATGADIYVSECCWPKIHKHSRPAHVYADRSACPGKLPISSLASYSPPLLARNQRGAGSRTSVNYSRSSGFVSSFSSPPEFYSKRALFRFARSFSF